TSGGDNLAPLLSTAVAGGKPPDIAALGQPGLVADFAKKGAIKPIDDLESKIEDAFGEDVAKAGQVDGKQYAVMFKGANKSTIWYNVADFKEAGVEPPKTWDDLDKARDTIKAAGITPYSVGVDVGWPMTDLFENIYLRTAGPEKYDQLAAHKIPWTDPSVKDALTEFGKIVGDPALVPKNVAGTTFEQSVDAVFKTPPDAAIVFEGDFVPGVASVKATAGTDYDFFPFPSIK